MAAGGALLKRINLCLSLFQLIGFALAFVLLTVLCVSEGGMMVFYIFFAVALFLPFLIVSCYSTFKSTASDSGVVSCIHFALLLLIVPAFVLPFVYEVGGIIILILCLVVGTFVFMNKSIDKKLIVLNIIGSLTLVSVIAVIGLEVIHRF